MLHQLLKYKRCQAIQQVCLVVPLVVGLAFALFWVNRSYPIKHWLFITYGQSLLLAGAFTLSCFAVGLQVLKTIRFTTSGGIRFQERWLVAAALGVVIFALGVFAAGLLHLYGHVFFVVWPLLLFGIGSRSLFREGWRVYRHRRILGQLFLPNTAIGLAAVLFTAYGLLLLYSHVLTPENLGYDARWYHLPIAEHYLVSGGIDKFEEGWYLAAYPQLATWLYTWAFQMPSAGLFDHVTLASHIEFLLLVLTLPGVAAVARRLSGARRVGSSAAAFFLFPSVWLYDSNLITGADHILAFWACPILLAVFAFARHPTAPRATIVAALVSGAALTKLQALYIVGPVGLAVAWIVVRRRAFFPALVGLLIASVLTSAYWLKNWVFYGDPLFPLLYKHLSLRPFTPGAGAAIEEVYKTPIFTPTGTLAHRLWESIEATFTFAFVPHDWDMFKGSTPVFGFLFTLLTPAWLLCHGRRRRVLLGAAVHLGVALWFFTNHQDRFLQALVPWMAAVVGATLYQLWQGGLMTRACAIAIVAFQLVWSGDIYFFNTHAMVGEAPVKRLADHLGKGHQGQYAARFRYWNETFTKVRRKTPSNARILVHRDHEKLGLGRQTVVDGRGFQSAFDYLDLANAGNAYGLMRKLRVSHILLRLADPGGDRAELAREVVFLHAAAAFAEETLTIDDLKLVKLKTDATPAKATFIGVASCDDRLPTGLYTTTSLAKGKAVRTQSAEHPLERLFRPATVVLTAGACATLSEVDEIITARFKRTWQFGDFTMYIEQNPLSAPTPANTQP